MPRLRKTGSLAKPFAQAIGQTSSGVELLGSLNAGAGGAASQSAQRPPVLLPWSRRQSLKVIWHDGQGACLFTKKLERGRFLWPSPADGAVTISTAQLGYLLSGMDWRNPQQTWCPTSVG